MQSWKVAAAFVLVLGAGACGGGGGGGGSDAPAIPQGLSANVNGGTIELAWTASPGAASYRVYYDLEPGVSRAAFALLGSVTAPAVGADVTPQPSFRAYFAVTAVNSDGESGLSNEVFASIPASLADDPLFSEQWHLENTGQDGGTIGEDAQLVGAWQAGFDGDGVRIVIVDDGLEIGHEDLFNNCPPGQSHNYINGSKDPTGGAHGTSCGGVAAAVAGNDLGVSGAAFESLLIGYNVLQNPTSSNVANAMTRDAAKNWVSSNSWGAADGLGVPQASSQTWRTAVESGLANGRDGLGLIYLWAAGNGGLTGVNPGDNSNCDGQANYHGVIAVGAVGDDGERASYSENGANLLVCAPSEGRGGHAITTVDRTGAGGYNDGAQVGDYLDPNYTNTFNGTSSATPLAAGVVALMLEANPDLTWRDVRLVLAQSARQNDAADVGWLANGAGHFFNHRYGFGVVDADAAVTLAQTWVNVGAQVVANPPASAPNLPIPDADPVTGVSDTIDIAGSGIGSIEHVEIVFDADNHTYVGDLIVFLTSPSGSISLLNEPHNVNGANVPFNGWVFGSNVHMDEPADGTWTLTVRDAFPGDTGTFKSWRLKVRGRS
jgi:proprotein convertase subtilisin/kexin type 2